MAQLANLTTTLAIESASFVNDIEQSRGAVRRLLESLDPAAKAQAKFNRQMDLAERGLKSGQISADLYEKVVARLKQRLDDASVGGSRLTQTNGQMRAGMQQLSYQIGDVSQGIAMGTSATTIFAQQSGQMIQALQLMTTESKGVLAVLGGPWGAILSAALVVAAPLVAKIFEGNDGLDKQIDKLKKDAESQRIASEANKVFAGTQAGLDQRIRETTNAINQQNASLRNNAELQNIRAKQEYADAQKRLADARSAVQAANQRVAQLSTPGATDPRLAGAKQDATDSLEAARKAARDAQDSIKHATQAVINSRVALAAEQAAADAAASTRAGKITKEYDDQIKAIKLKAAAAAQAGKDMSVAEYTQIKNLEVEKQAALEAIQTEKTARSKAIREGQAEARAAQRQAVKDAKQTASLIASAATGAYKAIVGLDKDQHKALMSAFGEGGKDWDAIAKRAETATKAQQEADIAAEKDLQRQRMQDVRDLAGLYYDLFTGGTKRLWQDFERWGFDVISQLLAKWTVGAAQGQAGGGLGGILGSIGKLFGAGGASVDVGAARAGADAALASISVPHFANGGSFQFGGRDGIDKNILSLNGSPIAKVSKGETATIGRGAANDRGPIVFDLRGAVMTQDLLEQMNQLAASNAISIVGAAQKVQAKQATRRLGR